MSYDSFISANRFYDSVHFPHGFHRAGIFTRSEAELLTNYGHLIKQLGEHRLLPQTPEHQRMLDVIEGAEAPETALEKTWMKYQNYIHSKRVFHHSGFSSMSRDHSQYDEQGW